MPYDALLVPDMEVAKQLTEEQMRHGRKEYSLPGFPAQNRIRAASTVWLLKQWYLVTPNHGHEAPQYIPAMFKWEDAVLEINGVQVDCMGGTLCAPGDISPMLTGAGHARKAVVYYLAEEAEEDDDAESDD